VLPLPYSAAATPVPVKRSILMAAYNEERTIRRVVQAVLGFHYPCDMELIAVNDGSRDRAAQLLEQIDDPRVVMHHHPVNRGEGAGPDVCRGVGSGEEAWLAEYTREAMTKQSLGLGGVGFPRNWGPG
jgi:Glycosyl transferase family 2